MKYEQISRKFTEIVAEYMGKGYTINTGTMSGHQGEDARVDLTDGHEIIRVILDSFHECGFKGYDILVGHAPANIQPNTKGSDIIWNKKIKPIRQERYYQIGNSRGGRVWYGTKEECMVAKELATDRWRMRTEVQQVSLPDAARAVAFRWLKKQRGRKSTKRSAVGEVFVSYYREQNHVEKHYYVRVNDSIVCMR